MATTRSGPDEPQPTAVARVEGAARVLIAGHERGAVRRIALYVVTFALCVSPIPVAAVLPLVLLIATDGAL